MHVLGTVQLVAHMMGVAPVQSDAARMADCCTKYAHMSVRVEFAHAALRVTEGSSAAPPYAVQSELHWRLVCSATHSTNGASVRG
jgi:hypothetical protein